MTLTVKQPGDLQVVSIGDINATDHLLFIPSNGLLKKVTLLDVVNKIQASTDNRGTVRIGSGLVINNEGIVSLSFPGYQGTYSASIAEKELITVTIDNTGRTTSAVAYDVVIEPEDIEGLLIDGGLNPDLFPVATTSSAGIITVGSGLNISGSTLSLPDVGSSSTYTGIVAGKNVLALTTDSKGRVSSVVPSSISLVPTDITGLISSDKIAVSLIPFIAPPAEETVSTKTFTGLLRVTNSTASTNSTSGAAVISGGMGVAGRLNVGGITTFSDGTQSSNSTSGAVTIAGGLGVGLNLHVGQNITAVGNVSCFSLGTSENISIGGTGTFQNNVTINGNLEASGTVIANGLVINTGSFTVNNGTINNDLGVSRDINVARNINISNALAVAGQSFFTGQVNAGSISNTTLTTTGTITANTLLQSAGHIYSANYIHAQTHLLAGTYINAETNITAGGDIYSTGRYYSYSTANSAWLDRNPEGGFTIGGNSSNYYPVIFRVRENLTSQAGSSRFKIYRSDVNYNGSALGSFDCEIRFAPFNWEQQPSTVEIDRYIVGQGTPYNDPLGDVIDGTFPTTTRANELVVWLKGGVTYFFKGLDEGYTWDLYEGNPSGGSVTAANGNVYGSISTQSQKVLKAKTRDNVDIPNYAAFLSRAGALGLAGGSNYFLFNSTAVRQYDTFNSTYNSWTPSISGLYKFTSQTSFYTVGGTAPTGHILETYIRKNDIPQVRLTSASVSTHYTNTSVSANGTGLLFVDAGDAITFSCNYDVVGGSGFTAYLIIESVVIEQLDIYQK
jgi:hypothetical protein